MSARQALRDATGFAHGRVDAAYSRFDLASEPGYRVFLLAQAEALRPIERTLDDAGAAAVVPDWPDRRRAHLLLADLADLSVTAPEPFAKPSFISGTASILGAIYVLEGSRLGGAVLKRAVPDRFPTKFLEARQNAGNWRRLLEILDHCLSRQSDLEAAILAAKEVFARFELAAAAQWES